MAVLRSRSLTKLFSFAECVQCQWCRRRFIVDLFIYSASLFTCNRVTESVCANFLLLWVESVDTTALCLNALIELTMKKYVL